MSKRKNNNWMKWGAVGALALGLYYALKGERSTDVAPPQTQTNTPPGTQTSTAPVDYDMVLAIGSRGAEVKLLQQLIGLKGSDIDGIFGNQTEGALFSATGLRKASINQARRAIQDRIALAATEQQKKTVIFSYPLYKIVMAAVDVKAPIGMIRNGIWQYTDSRGESLGSVTIKKGMDIGTIEGWYDYTTPWIRVQLNNNFGPNSGKLVMLKGSWVTVAK